MQNLKSNGLSVTIFVGSIVAMLYALYVIQQLSIAIGIGTGIAVAGSTYNITFNSTIAAILNSLPTFRMGSGLTYLAFTLSIILFAVGIMQLFQNRPKRTTNIALAITALVYLVPVTLLQATFGLSEPLYLFAVSYIGCLMVLVPSIYGIMESRVPAKSRGMAKNIGLDPLTPYSNMLKLSQELTSKLNGHLKLLDMHFDSVGLRNLSALIMGNEGNYSAISVLAKKERFDQKFIKECRDFRDEMSNKGITFDARIMNDEDSSMQHERLLIDNNHAYKIPPLNIINKKSEHIVKIGRKEASRRFDYIWSRATKLDNLQ